MLKFNFSHFMANIENQITKQRLINVGVNAGTAIKLCNYPFPKSLIVDHRPASLKLKATFPLASICGLKIFADKLGST